MSNVEEIYKRGYTHGFKDASKDNGGMMNKITALMTSLHEGHKSEERLKCIDNMLFKKCEDTKYTILQAFWWYRKHSIPLDKVKQAREEIQKLVDMCGSDTVADLNMKSGLGLALEKIDKLIESEDKK